MPDRFFAARGLQGTTVVLDDQEGHHLARVLRARPGHRVTLFDGAGREAHATVQSVKRDQVTLSIDDVLTADREAPREIVIAAALPKGDRQRFLIEKLVEIGARRFIPLSTARSVAEPTAKALDRLERVVIEASKQCGRNRLMEIAPRCDWAAFLDGTPSDQRRLVAHPGAHATAIQRWNTTEPVTFAVGPEGGLREDELQAALDGGWEPVSLGQRVLRVETAAMVLAALAAFAEAC